MKQSKAQRLTFTAIILAVFFLLPSCEKPDDFGKDIITTPGDQLGVLFNDTSSILAHSIILDSIQTDETSLNLLGSMNDPVFGNTTASIFTQIRLNNSNISFGNNARLDSIVLNLVMKGEYVSKNMRGRDKVLSIKVYELDSSLSIDSSYFNNQSIAYNPSPIAQRTLIPNVKDSIVIDSLKYPPYFSIRLADAFGQKILNASGTIYLADNSNFLSYIKGLYIKADKSNLYGSITYIDLLSSYSKITLYYQNDDDTVQLKQDFLINENCARFTQIKHYNYATARPDFVAQTMTNGGDSTLGAQKLFVQAMGGVRTRIYLPHLTDWVAGKKIAVSKAVLVIPLDQDENTFPYLSPPGKLSLVKVNSDGNNSFILDQTSEGDANFGGTYDAIRKEYRFTISRHVQKILNGGPDYGMNLLVSGSAVSANRAILGGTASQYKMRLELTYVEL
jgi:hypothetical protein